MPPASEHAVVVEDNGHLRGYLMRSRAFGEGTVADRVRRLDAWVRSDATLKDAFSEMLLHDAGWVAVLDHDDRFLGVLTPQGLLEAARTDDVPGD